MRQKVNDNVPVTLGLFEHLDLRGLVQCLRLLLKREGCVHVLRSAGIMSGVLACGMMPILILAILMHMIACQHADIWNTTRCALSCTHVRGDVLASLCFDEKLCLHTVMY